MHQVHQVHQVHMQGQAWWAASILCRNSWWHVKQVEQGTMDMTQGMKHQVEGPMSDESVWAVQLVEHTGRKVVEAR
jgi:hypothetical protein